MEPHDLRLQHLTKLREAYESSVKKLLDEHLDDYYPDCSDRWRLAKRFQIETASWPEWKRKACYAQPDS